MRNDPRLEQAVALFNQQEFFACHDVLEEVWSETVGERKELYQGLIHAAVALHHFSEGNLGGARKMYQSTVTYLGPFREVDSGCDIARLLDELKSCFEGLLSATEYPTGLTMPLERIPHLHILP
jgi:predicted metal-dependent hydrolase